MVSQQSVDREAADPYCLRPGEAAACLRGHPWRRFVVVGDSVAEGLGEAVPGYRDNSWTDRIADALAAERPDLAHLNLGKRNLTAAEVRAHQLADAVAFGPDLVLVACGGFDVLQRTYDDDAVGAEIEAIIQTLREQSCDVVTVGLFDGSYSPYVPDKLRAMLHLRLGQLADRTAALSTRYGGIHVSLTRHPAAKNPDLYGSDGRHGTRRSHAIAAAECIRRLGARLDEIHGETCRARQSRSA
ncbi:SGNH/GDSL hydrolase family protein [Actinokineospora sp.]|uniref:SGNH/GDSL hydrolase family protein n=1 Tax=Actinokineospora sp. TaxID=1872133 RepID=UPI00403789C6